MQRPGELPSFRAGRGTTDLKRELKDTFGLILAFADEAEQYRINWNGVLLHGPRGGQDPSGAGRGRQFGLNFISVTTGELVSAYRETPRANLRAAFRPPPLTGPACSSTSSTPSPSGATISQTRSRAAPEPTAAVMEKWRPVRELIVVAATTPGQSRRRRDEAGRFDRHIRIDLPDAEARRAIFVAQLKDRPTSGRARLGRPRAP